MTPAAVSPVNPVLDEQERPAGGPTPDGSEDHAQRQQPCGGEVAGDEGVELMDHLFHAASVRDPIGSHHRGSP